MMATVAARTGQRHGGFDHAVTAVIVFNTAALAASLIVDGHAGARFAGAVVFIR
jgi:hypothetical protein